MYLSHTHIHWRRNTVPKYNCMKKYVIFWCSQQSHTIKFGFLMYIYIYIYYIYILYIKHICIINIQYICIYILPSREFSFTWLCVTFCSQYEMNENNYTHSTAMPVHSNNQAFLRTKHLQVKMHLMNHAWHKNQILVYIQIVSAKSQTARGAFY